MSNLTDLLEKLATKIPVDSTFEFEYTFLGEPKKRLHFRSVLAFCHEYCKACMTHLETRFQTAVESSTVEPSIQPTISPVSITLPETLHSQLSDEQISSLHTTFANLIKREALNHLILLGHEISQSKKLTLYNADSTAPARKGHCYVLGIGSSSTSKSQTIVHPDIRVTVLLCTAKHAHQALEKRNRFFIQALSQGKALYTHETEQPLSVPAPDWSQTLEKSRTAWLYRKYKSDSFLQCAQLALDTRQDLGVAAMLLAQSLEQLCTGLIYACIGYRVDQFHIPFLLTVCNLVSPRLAECFVTGHDVDKNALKALVSSLNAIRYKKEATITDVELAAAMVNYERFRTLALQLCEAELEDLGKLAVSGNPDR